MFDTTAKFCEPLNITWNDIRKDVMINYTLKVIKDNLTAHVSRIWCNVNGKKVLDVLQKTITHIFGNQFHQLSQEKSLDKS